MMNISIIAATFYGNRGAEAMLSTTIGEIRARYNGALHFNVYSYYPKRDANLVADPHVTVHSSTPTYLVLVLLPCAILFRLLSFLGFKALRVFLPESVKAMERSRMLICLAGVAFVDGRTKFLPFNIATILPAMLLGVPVIKFAQALGPFKGRLNRLVAQEFLRRCLRIFTRGDRTQFYLEELLARNTNFERADDVAFLFKPEYCLSTSSDGLENALSRLKNKQRTGQLVVGVCPSSVVAKSARETGWDYTQCIVELIVELIGKGYQVALYPNATRGEDMDKTHNNDLPLLDDIERKLPKETMDKVVKFGGSLNAAQIHNIINTCDVNVLSRFHSMVAALSSGVPVLVIGWSHKYLEVMECFSQEDMVIDYKHIGPTTVMKLLERLLEERSQRGLTIMNSLPEVCALSRRQVDFAAEYLRKTL